MQLNHEPLEPYPEFVEHKSTLMVPSTERMDHWRAWHPTVALTPLAGSARLGIEAELVRYRAPGGILFGFARCDSMESRFGRAHLADYFLMGTPLSGAATAVGGRTELSIRDGRSLYIVDGRREAYIRTSADFSHLYLLLPRALVVDAVGRDSFTGRQPILELGHQGLLATANSALRTLREQIGVLDEEQLAGAVRMLSGFVVLGLKARLGHQVDVDRPDTSEMLFSTARRLMQVHYADRSLTASMLAAAIGCSRAHLYRTFFRRGATVADALREIRMTKAKSLLVGSRRRSLAEVAALTGYADQSSFSRAFSASTGMTPGKWRRFGADREHAAEPGLSR